MKPDNVMLRNDDPDADPAWDYDPDAGCGEGRRTKPPASRLPPECRID